MNEEEEKKKFHEELARIGATRVTGYSSPELKTQVNEDTRSTVAPTPAVEKDEATPTGYDYLQQFTEKYTPEVLTQEELNRRKRSAYIREGIGALGNAASAISNLIYTGEGAPSQTLPKNVDASAEIAKLEETEKAKRNEIYQRAKDRVAQEQAKKQWEYKQQQDATNNAFKQQELALEISKAQREQEKLLYDMQLAKQRGETEKYNTLYKQYQAIEAGIKAMYAEQQQQANIKRTNASAAASYASADKSTRQAENELLSVKYNNGENEFKVSSKAWNNPTTLGAVAKMLGMDVKWEDNGATAKWEQDGKVKYFTKEQLQAIIGSALLDPNNAEAAFKIEAAYGTQADPESSGSTGHGGVVKYKKKKKEEEKIEEYQ